MRAMVLDDAGGDMAVRPAPELDRAYTVTEVASFARWYLDDYPVFCQIRDYGMLVLGMPKGSIARYNFYSDPDLITGIFANTGRVLVAVVVLIFVGCLLVSWRSTRSLQAVTDGTDILAGGGTVDLPTKGFTGELARRLNQTSEQLRSRNQIIQRRDEARTNWIAGVSHDIRTPLSLIWAGRNRSRPTARCPRRRAKKRRASATRARRSVPWWRT